MAATLLSSQGTAPRFSKSQVRGETRLVLRQHPRASSSDAERSPKVPPPGNLTEFSCFRRKLHDPTSTPAGVCFPFGTRLRLLSMPTPSLRAVTMSGGPKKCGGFCAGLPCYPDMPTSRRSNIHTMSFPLTTRVHGNNGVAASS